MERITPARLGNSNYYEAACVLGRAFQDDPMVVAVFRELPAHERVRRLIGAFTPELIICIKKGLPLYIGDQDSIVAAAVIYPPGSYPLSASDQLRMISRVISVDGFYGLGRWLKILSVFSLLHPKLPHYYLEYLGVEPSWTGMGLGSAILKFITEKADSEQTGIYLENANSRNNPLYQRFGFKITRQRDILGTRFWFMWRDPAEKAI
jgi:GNAT superfamily N-acetyltransferase